MHTLILDTSGTYTSVAVIQDEAVLGFAALKIQPLSHLHDLIRTMARQLDLAMTAFDQIGVVIGPGSWTGLNIGVTAAKTLAQVLEVPVVALPTLDALVAARRWTPGRVCALLNAKRDNVYCAWYPTDATGAVRLADGHAQVMPFSAWTDALTQETSTPLVVEYGDAYQERLHPLRPAVCLANQEQLSPEALLLTLKIHQTTPHTGDALLTLSPDYMQPSLAERDWPG